MRQLFLIFVVITIFIQCSDEARLDYNKIHVAVFNGLGASETCIIETFEALKIDTGIVPGYISAAELNSAHINKFDVIIFPGGSASAELNNIGAQGEKKIKEFVEQGGGLVGICAGGYLLSTTKNYPSLKIVSATEWDREHYDKGRALVEFEMTQPGLEIFPELKNVKSFLQYYDGPVFMPSDSGVSGKKEYEEFAVYKSDIAIKQNYPAGITPGKTFLLGQNIGKGKAMAIAGHPEATPGMRWMVARMARWAANKELISYEHKWVKPEIYNTAIFYTDELIKQEKTLFWKLLSPLSQDKIDAMLELYSLKSRPAVRWNIGLLRDDFAEVRKLAAELLMLNEYSAALPDLNNALLIERDSLTKAVIQKSIKYFHTDL